LSGDGLPLGILDDFETHTTQVTLSPGDILVSYSDGYSEAKASSGDRFGLARLAQALQACAGRSARDTLDHIGAAVDRFTEPEPQADDQTIIVVCATES
jgi:serine phosphatase RsbU (regulator of sigma subunit)